MLVREGLIKRTDLYDALRLQRQNNRLLGTCLLMLGYVNAEGLLTMLSRQLAIPALPPGSLKRAKPAAVARVPKDVAVRLRVLPYSWDGKMLGVAIADGRVLPHLQEVAYHAQAAVGAYVALELEIDEALATFYGASASSVLGAAPSSPKAGFATSPERVGVDTASRVIQGAPPVAATDVLIERMGLFDAMEQLHEVDAPARVGRLVGQALLNYFSRVLILTFDSRRYRVIGCAGASPNRVEVPADAMPLVTKRLGAAGLSYGLATMDVRAAELAGVLGIESGETALIASLGTAPAQLVLLADNATSSELYEDLHDVDMLYKEAEVALRLLVDSA